MKTIAYYLGIACVCGMLFLSCERDDDEKNNQNHYEIDKSKVYVDDDYENRLKDSVWYYYKYLSLWESGLSPITSDIGKMDSTNYLKDNYTKYFQSASDVLGYLMYLTKANVIGKSVKSNAGSGNSYMYYKDIIYDHVKGESKAYDWYSFLDRGGFITGAVQEGYISGFGMDLMYLQKASIENADLFIRFIEKNSAAYNAGLRRGQQIISLNGDTKIDYNSQKSSNFNTLNNYLNSSNLEVKYKTPDGVIKTVNIAYRNNSFVDAVYIDTILNVGNTKVAYVGLSSFLSTDAWVNDKGVGKSFQTRLREVFEKFTAQNVSEMIVDLRYNGGGSVLTAEYLSDVMAPTSASGQLMYTYKINSILKEFGWDKPGDEFAPVYFSKKGNLNLSRVYFIVTNETASASELLINTLSPYMQVYMVGNYSSDGKTNIAQNTYGKPVGFFPVEIVSSSNELYVTSFQMFNKNGVGDYFAGLKPNSHVWEYDSFLDFGNQEETMLATALGHIKTGVFKSTQSRSVSGKTNFERKFSQERVSPRKIQGMYKFPAKKVHF
ncbi:S41 family peptidase [Sphingobacterium bovisgrunnientis]|jgi:carboxyl-terminal processing protease|uniref:S41 family peptidase n=1 Tax=Sphingobacterium bovisgrunnientis TaxID=1874697 RepID=UPI00135B6F84|nr:S41 family peptidase [Sphingobacterium bovisgrunnientis]